MWNLPRPRIEPCVPCIGRQILNHCTTRDIQKSTFFSLVQELSCSEACQIFLNQDSWICISCIARLILYHWVTREAQAFFFLFLISKHFCLFLIFLATLYSTWNLSSPTRGWTHNPCIGSAESYHWTTGEVPHLFLLECSHSLKQSGWVFISIFPVGFEKSKCGWRNRCLKSWHYFLYVKVYFFHIIYTFFF